MNYHTNYLLNAAISLAFYSHLVRRFPSGMQGMDGERDREKERDGDKREVCLACRDHINVSRPFSGCSTQTVFYDCST